MVYHHGAAHRRVRNTVRKRVLALSLLLLLPGLTSGCRNAKFSNDLLSNNIRLSESESPATAPPKTKSEPESVAVEPETTKHDEVGGIQEGAVSTAMPERTAPIEEDGLDANNLCADEESSHTHLFVLPEHPTADSPVRIVGTTRIGKGGSLSLSVFDENGESVRPERVDSWGYIPRAASVYFLHLDVGEYNVVLRDEVNGVNSCSLITIDNPDASESSSSEESIEGVWRVRHDWSPAFEDLYSVFIAKLFYVRPGGSKGWRPLHQATRDPFRNILYGILGYNEDAAGGEPTVRMEPDCADAPYQLRVYFAWKMGLPFMFNRCNRGSSIKGPTCLATHGSLTKRFDSIADPVKRFNSFAATHVGWKVHSGNGRTLPTSESGDLYPVSLTAEAIRPGTVFVDAGGHVILVSQVEPQSDSRIGVLYGVDAHPDKTVTHKLFGIGTFVFNHRVPTDGFKMFRPTVLNKDRLRMLNNRELSEYGFFPVSNQQAALENKEAFYNEVSSVLNPKKLEPEVVLKNKIEILFRAMLERSEAVDLGVAYMKENNWRQMAMPVGPAIFQTTGPWEIYSTPARDMRCFLAIDDVMKFPEQAVADRERYVVPGELSDDALLEKLIEIRDDELAKREIQYLRSDGSEWALSLSDVIDRQKMLEMAYNPNDCVEIRWGAPADSEEMATCNRKAPAEQRFRMKLARRWFAQRRRPDQR